MPQLGLGTEIGRVSGGAYDSDALAYFSRAGIASGTQTPSSYDNAASFTSASSQFLTSTAANLQCQSQSFTVAGWFFMPSNAPAYSPLITQGAHPVAAGGGFTLQRFDNLNFVYLDIRNDNASNSVSVNSPVFVPSTWNFVECGWDSALNRSFISLNGGTRSFSTAVAGWTFPNTTNTTRLGRDPFGLSLTGNLAGWGLWKRALTASEVSQLWNNGAGRTYASLDSTLRTNLVSWWALNQNSVTADSHGTNTLTNNGSVTAPNIGPIVTTTENSRQLINNFVKGIKSLGLWNSMVCWPLRASQNAGAGLTARSLGGLGNFDGTLAGGTLPSWTANGLSLAASSQMNASVTTVPQNVTLLFAAAGDGAANTSFAQYLQLQGSSTWVSNQAGFQDQQGNTDLYLTQRNSTFDSTAGTAPRLANPFRNSTNFAFVAGSLNTTAPSSNVRNLSAGTTNSLTPNTTGTNTLNRLQLNGRWAGSLELGTPHTAAFCGYITPASDGQVSAIYSLYRNTLGIGLNLP
jgi:hypothetical protein